MKLLGRGALAIVAVVATVIGVAAVEPGGSLIVQTGERAMTLAWGDLKDYRGARAQRGAVLPRGWRRVTRLEAVAAS